MLNVMIFRSSSKLGQLGSETKSAGQIKETLVNALNFTFLGVFCFINLAQNVCLEDF